MKAIRSIFQSIIPSNETSEHYRPAIDGLRAIAVLSVFIYHLNRRWLPGGFVGVDLFFVISGFLMTSIISRPHFTLSRFYQRRIARIFPAFFTVAITTVAGAYLIYSPQDLASAGANLAAAALSIANMKFMVQGNYFELSPDAQPFLHYWSLSLEEQFYILFPLLLLFLLKYSRNRLQLTLLFLSLVSLFACLLVTRMRPVWAFYLLPTRAWELLSGGVLFVWSSGKTSTMSSSRCSKCISICSLALIFISFFVIHEGSSFPGFWAILPVAGALGVLRPVMGTPGISERLLAGSSVVLFIGRMSYSIYLWHWPIFSLVDYKMCLVSEQIRIPLKVFISVLMAYLSFRFVETPARHFFNGRQRGRLAFLFLAVSLVLTVAIGISIRKANYINAESRDVSKGGLVFNARSGTRSVVLMGDSYGSMYAKVLKDICADLDLKLVVISVAAGDPLPQEPGTSDQLWRDSLKLVSEVKPDFLILACNWQSKLKIKKDRLDTAVAALKPFTGKLIIINQPPVLPADANRASIRMGSRPPYFEDAEIRVQRLEVNRYLTEFESTNSVVIDASSPFQSADGSVLFFDKSDRQLYHDSDHLSGYGAGLIKPQFERALSPGRSN